jgi:hypothetical protein
MVFPLHCVSRVPDAPSHKKRLLVVVVVVVVVGLSFLGTGVAPVASHRGATALAVNIAEADMSADQREIVNIMAKWKEVRHLTREEAANLEDEEWKAAHTRFMEKYDKDMVNMQDIASKLVTMLEPPKVEKKSKSQRKRDKWAIVQAREKARAVVAAK